MDVKDVLSLLIHSYVIVDLATFFNCFKYIFFACLSAYYTHLRKGCSHLTDEDPVLDNLEDRQGAFVFHFHECFFL